MIAQRGRHDPPLPQAIFRCTLTDELMICKQQMGMSCLDGNWMEMKVIDIGLVEHGTWNPESPETLRIHVWQYMYVF